MTKPVTSLLRPLTLRTARLHFIYALVLAVQIVVYDAWKLIEPNVVLRRWLAVAALVLVTTAVWYLAHTQKDRPSYFKKLILALILVDIFVASFNVYIQRGMAARAVMLYAIPIIVSAVLVSRSAIFATALLCIVAYVTTAISYFVLNFNEGYKIELYGEIVFYSAIFLLLAALVTVVVKRQE